MTSLGRMNIDTSFQTQPLNPVHNFAFSLYYFTQGKQFLKKKKTKRKRHHNPFFKGAGHVYQMLL